MAKIRRVRWRPFRIPFRQEFRAAHGLLEAREAFVVQVVDTVGHVGLGEASPLPSFVGGSMEATGIALERLARASLRWQAMDVALRNDKRRGFLPAKAKVTDLPRGAWTPALVGLQTAALTSEVHDEPLFRAISDSGQAHEPTAVIPVNAILGEAPPDEVAADASARVAEGFDTLKLKAGRDHALNMARVRAVRDAVGPAVHLRLDANASWPLDEAERRLRELAEFGLALVEQPVPVDRGALREMGRLQAATGATIAADESLVVRFESTLPHDDDEDIDLDTGPRVWVVKPMLHGVDAAAVLATEPPEERQTIITTTFDAGIGTALAMHIAALLAMPPLACGLDTLRFLEGDIVTGVPPVVAGKVTLSERPGLGVELDEGALAHYATGPWREVHT